MGLKVCSSCSSLLDSSLKVCPLCKGEIFNDDDEKILSESTSYLKNNLKDINPQKGLNVDDTSSNTDISSRLEQLELEHKDYKKKMNLTVVILFVTFTILMFTVPNGKVGSQGIQGEQGITGLTGLQGIQGLSGAQGESVISNINTLNIPTQLITYFCGLSPYGSSWNNGVVTSVESSSFSDRLSVTTGSLQTCTTRVFAP